MSVQRTPPRLHPLRALPRRRLLQGGAAALTVGGLGLLPGCQSSPGGGGGVSWLGEPCLSILYRNGDNVSFDFDYYAENHMPLIMDRYAGSIERFELRRPLLVTGAPLPPFVAAINIWISDGEAFAAAGEEHGAEVAADVANFTNTMLVAQNEVIRGEAGAGLQAPERGQNCMTILYPFEEGARWDADYYREQHMPLIMDLYGREAIRRFELREATSTEGVAFLGSANIYIEDQEAFDAAGALHTRTLVDDVPNFSSVLPLAFNTVIHAVA